MAQASQKKKKRFLEPKRERERARASWDLNRKSAKNLGVFSVESGTTDRLAQAKRARPSPSIANSNKHWRTRAADGFAETS